MELFIVRHGIAQDSQDLPDAQRALTEEGRRKTRLVARGLKAVDCRPQRVISSPLPRAEQTAQIMAELLCPEAPLETSDLLKPGADVETLISRLTSLDESSVMLVGHMPDVAVLACMLLTKQGFFDIVFKKAGVCCVTFEGPVAAGTGSLQWLMQPAQMQVLAKR